MDLPLDFFPLFTDIYVLTGDIKEVGCTASSIVLVLEMYGESLSQWCSQILHYTDILRRIV